jgi:acetylornithine/succinyldiaminopimelate/putrescine aminotransferase/predicted amino acid dehydrogenase
MLRFETMKAAHTRETVLEEKTDFIAPGHLQFEASNFDFKSREFELLELFFGDQGGAVLEKDFEEKKDFEERKDDVNNPVVATIETARAAYQAWCKPGLGHLLGVLRLDQQFISALGNTLCYQDQEDRKVEVTDFLGGYGSLILGHNHPELTAFAIEVLKSAPPIHAQGSIKSEATALAQQLHRTLALKTKYISHFLNTGTEAVEAALKHAFLSWQHKHLKKRNRFNRAVVLTVEGSYHGKTMGALAVTHQSKYKAMFPGSAIETVAVPRGAGLEEILSLLHERGIQASDEQIVAVLVEPIQGEGGIHPLSQTLITALHDLAKKWRVPFIVDEIQSGLFRTGEPLAIQAYGVTPDYILLGKSLGGGIAKISACLIREELYLPQFDLLHSSTMAEDHFSLRVALKSMQLLETQASEIKCKAELFERQFLQRVQQIQARYPGAIRQARGRGFFLGVQFNSVFREVSSFAMEMLDEAGYLSYCISSFLLHRYQLRVGATLTSHNTLRIEPSIFIDNADLERLLAGLEEVAAIFSLGEFGRLVSHLFSAAAQTEIENSGVRRTHPAVRFTQADLQGLPHVGFLCHLIGVEHLKRFDPILSALTDLDRKKFHADLGHLLPGALCERQIIQGAQGQKIVFDLFGLAYSSEFFEKSLLRRDHKALEKVRFAMHRMAGAGARFIGLGQYSSIVTLNGRAVSDLGIPVTTGNALTAALALEGVKRLLAQKGRSLESIHLGVVGPAGNICNVLSQILVDQVRDVTLVHRDAFGVSPKFQDAVERIHRHSNRPRGTMQLSSSLADLRACDVVIIGTNSSLPLLHSEHLKTGAIVLDISVPSNISPNVLNERPDVECFSGGTAALPLGQKFACTVLPLENGEVFGCMAETILCGLLGLERSYSTGPLTKDHVLDTWAKAVDMGFQLGHLKRVGVI